MKMNLPLTGTRSHRIACAALSLLALVFTGAAIAKIEPITARELVEVRDLSGLAVSPDGKTAVVQVQAPSVGYNDVTLSWYAVSLGPHHRVCKVSDGGSPMRDSVGDIEPEIPQWSSDSVWFYYRALHGTQVQVWRTRRDGTRTQQVTEDAADVKSFRVDPKADRLFYVVGATRAAILRAERKEDDRGVIYSQIVAQSRGRIVNNLRYHGRWATRRRTAAGEVSALGPVHVTIKVVNLTTLRAHVATAEERAAYRRLLAPVHVQAVQRTFGAWQKPDGQSVVFLAATAPLAPAPTTRQAILKRLASPPRFQVRWAGSTSARASRACTAPVCSGAMTEPIGIEWRPGTDQVLIVAAGPHGSTETTLYAWDTKRGTIRTITSGGVIYATDHNAGWGACPIAHDRMICIAEAAAEPPELQSIDLRTARRSVLFDPNPSLRGNRFGPVKVLTWKDRKGDEFNGYLLLPPGRRASAPLPLIITTYRCPGFLRGGTGDEYPGHLFAAAGFAVLCANIDPDRIVAQDKAGHWLPIPGMKLNVLGWEAAIHLLASRGIVDPKRVGLTGLSFGARNTLYAISHSSAFAAASTSSGSDLEPWSDFLNNPRGSMGEAIRGLEGLPPPLDDPHRIWEQVSPSRNAQRIHAPLLIQVADSELDDDLLEFRAFMLRARKPFEIVVFPDETHQKWQPIHKLVAYERNVDWFRFWLQGYEDPAPSNRAQYRRWQNLRKLIRGR